MPKGQQVAEQEQPQKKERSPKQIAAFEKARAARAAKMQSERQESGALGGETGQSVTAANKGKNQDGGTRRKGGESGRSVTAETTGGTMTTTKPPVRGISEHTFGENWMQGAIYLQGLCNQAGALLSQSIASAGQGSYTLAHNYEVGALNFLMQARNFTDNRPGR
jgi:hypothetical protein